MVLPALAGAWYRHAITDLLGNLLLPLATLSTARFLLRWISAQPTVLTILHIRRHSPE